MVTCSVFAPNPGRVLTQIKRQQMDDSSRRDDTNDSQQQLRKQLSEQQQQQQQQLGAKDAAANDGYVVVSGDYDGDIKVFYTFSKPKHSSLPAAALNA